MRVLDNFSTGRRGNLVASHGDVEVTEGDVRSYDRAQRRQGLRDYVIHLAGLAAVPRSVEDPPDYERSQRNRHSEHAVGGPRCGCTASGPGFPIVDLWIQRDDAQTRRSRARTHLALRCIQAGCGAVRARVLSGPRARSGLAVLLQRARPAPTFRRLRQRGPDLRRPDPEGRTDDDLR